MEIPWSTIIWLGVAVSVYIFGLYEGRNQGYKKRKAEEEQERKENPHVPASLSTPVTVKVDDPGLMRIKNENGYLTLDLDGVRADTTSLTADQRKRLIEMLTLIRPWLEGRPAPAPAPAMPAPTAPPQHPAQRGPAMSAPIPSAPKLASQPVPSQGAASATAKTAATAKDERSAPPATGIVGQIDSILQTRLVGTPLERRGIYLSNSPEGGVIVNVGLQKFNGIDEVTDPEIKAALRAAITEWENKYTPGL
jgi:hypothetical protein